MDKQEPDKELAAQLAQAWDNLPPGVQDRWSTIIRQIPLPPISFGDVAFTPLEKIEPEEWVQLFSADPLMCAKLLVVANSAAMGLITPITNLKRAVVHLGGSLVRIIVLGYYIEGLLARWDHYPKEHFAFIRSWSALSAATASNFAKGHRLKTPRRWRRQPCSPASAPCCRGWPGPDLGGSMPSCRTKSHACSMS